MEDFMYALAMAFLVLTGAIGIITGLFVLIQLSLLGKLVFAVIAGLVIGIVDLKLHPEAK